LQLPAGWKASPAEARLRLTPGEARTVDVTVTPPASPREGESTLRATFEDRSGADFARGYTLIDYPHIRPEPLYRPAETRVRAFEVRLPQAIRVGYVAGVGDDAPAALRQMGADVTLLDEAALASGDLSRFQAIVT